MPMNEQPPWGRKKKPSAPEDILAQIIQAIRDFFEGQGNGKNRKTEGPGVDKTQPDNTRDGALLTAFVITLAILQLGLSAFFTIAPGEVGVVQRFGRYDRTTEPGLHLKIPYIEQLTKVDVERVRKEEFGFRSSGQGQNSRFDRTDYEMESLILTGDKNVIEMAWIVQYKVSDPVHFLFKVRDVPQAVRDVSEMVIRRLVGNMDFDYVLGNRDALAAAARQELQDELNDLEAGINVFTIQLQDINPPEPVKPAFNEVNEADQDMMRLVNEAEKVYNEIIRAWALALVATTAAAAHAPRRRLPRHRPTTRMSRTSATAAGRETTCSSVRAWAEMKREPMREPTSAACSMSWPVSVKTNRYHSAGPCGYSLL